jgi:hypothetical protein
LQGTAGICKCQACAAAPPAARHAPLLVLPCTALLRAGCGASPPPAWRAAAAAWAAGARGRAPVDGTGAARGARGLWTACLQPRGTSRGAAFDGAPADVAPLADAGVVDARPPHLFLSIERDAPASSCAQTSRAVCVSWRAQCAPATTQYATCGTACCRRLLVERYLAESTAPAKMPDSASRGQAAGGKREGPQQLEGVAAKLRRVSTT